MKEKKKLPPVLENLIKDRFRFSQSWNGRDYYRRNNVRLYYDPKIDKVIDEVYLMEEGLISMGKNVYDEYNRRRRR